MNNPKENFLDRIEQSFDLFKSSAKELFLPLFAYQFITMIVIYTILSSIFFSMFNFGGDIASSKGILDSFGELYQDPQFILFISISIFLVLLYLTIFIPFLVATIKGVSLAYKGEKVDILEIIKYGFINISNSFQTYWYIFAYIALIPSLIIIIGGLGVIYGQSFGNNGIMNISFYIVGIGAFILMISSIVRGIKSTFALYGAIDYDKYTKENFKSTISITENNWRRIWGNMFLLGLIISLVSGIFGSIISMISGIGGFSITDLLSIKTAEDVTKILSTIGNTTIFSILGDTLNLIISTIAGIFTYIFLFILFKRLEVEASMGTGTPLGIPVPISEKEEL